MTAYWEQPSSAITYEQLLANTRAFRFLEERRHANQFLLDASGSPFSFGTLGSEICKATGLADLPIYVCNGRHIPTGGGFGIRHILESHGNQIAADGYTSVQDFISACIEQIDEVYASTNPGREASTLIVRLKEPTAGLKTVMVLDIGKGGTCYVVVTAYGRLSEKKVNGRPIWRAPRITLI